MGRFWMEPASKVDFKPELLYETELALTAHLQYLANKLPSKDDSISRTVSKNIMSNVMMVSMIWSHNQRKLVFFN